MNKNSELQSDLLQSIYPGTIKRVLDQKKVECINNIFDMSYLHINSRCLNPSKLVGAWRFIDYQRLARVRLPCHTDPSPRP